MKLVHHQNLDQEKWHSSPLAEQLANVGSEVNRTVIWKNKGNKAYADLAFERALELIDLIVERLGDGNRLREIIRVREALIDWYVGENQYQSSDQLWQKYFLAYNYLARLRR